MDLKLQITKKEGTNMSSLVKQMCALDCRIKVELEEGTISVVGMDDNNVEGVIDSINEAFDILAVDIIPTIEIPEPVITEDSFEVAKIKFSDPYVEKQVDKLMKTIAWAMYARKVHSKDICQFIGSIGKEISMIYAPYDKIEFKIGDIVNCYYGKHHSGEVSGMSVHAVVCDIDDEGLVYVAPITKARRGENTQKYMRFEGKIDVDYINSKFTGGTVLLRKGGYVCPERIQSIVGFARPDFFQRLLAALPKAINFSCVDYEVELSERLGDVQNDDCLLAFGSGQPVVEVLTEEVDEVPATEVTTEEAEETPATEVSAEEAEETPAAKDPVESVKESIDSNKELSMEEYVAALVANSLETLDKSKPMEEQIDMFLDSIGFPKNERIIKLSFAAACKVKKVGYSGIASELHNTLPGVDKNRINKIMRDEFKKWIANYPEAKEKYPKLSFMVLLKVFSKKMR